MKTTFYLLTFFLVSLLACQDKTPDLAAIETYFPSKNVLKEGIVNKYYFHVKEAKSHDIRTDIDYGLYQLTTENKLINNYYNPGFELTTARELAFDGNQLSLLEEAVHYKYYDTIVATIQKPAFLSLEQTTDNYETRREYSWGSRTYRYVQQQIRDTIIFAKPAKIFEGELFQTLEYDGKTILDTSAYQKIFVNDLGLYSSYHQDESGKSWTELVEQIPMKQFQEMANHGRHRIAYIDPEKTMDDATNFKICNEDIADYYNHDLGNFPIFKGGKVAMQKILDVQVDEAKLFHESGYLTFRFVINCEGQAGRFITEQTDLDFQRKTFNPVTIEHFYGIIKNIKDWRTTMIRKEARDAYAYITFKLNDGEIIELLP